MYLKNIYKKMRNIEILIKVFIYWKKQLLNVSLRCIIAIKIIFDT